MKLTSLIVGLTLMAIHPWSAQAQLSKAAGIPPAEGDLQYVNPLQGTDSGFGTSKDTQSYGNCLPLICAPWAMLDWSLQTDGDASRGSVGQVFFKYKQKRMLGFRVTRMPSPFTADYGTCLITPHSGPLPAEGSEVGSNYDLNACTLRPDYMRVDLKDLNVVAELTPSERGGVMRFTFANAKEGRIFLDPGGKFSFDAKDQKVTGWTKLHNGPASNNFTTYFVGVLDRPITGSGSHSNAKKAKIGGYIEFDVTQKPVVEFRFAQSYISLEQAQLNLKTETSGGFDAVRASTAATWLKYMNRISIEGTDDQKKTFYTCLYRAMIFPHRLHEVDAQGKTVHFSPFDGKLHDGVEYTDSGLWDTYRTQYPLYSVVYPERLGEIVQGWVNAFQEAGRLPEWPNPAGLTGMIGTHADAMIADAIVKGVSGIDVNKAYEAIRNDAFGTAKARAGQTAYLKLGYVPIKGAEYWVSTTLDYAYDDWCVAQVAKILGKTDDEKQLTARAQNYRKLWDPSIGFMRGKTEDGAWAPSFDEFAWGAAYAEGGPWQASWAVQHDMAGLAGLLGGKEALATKLDKLVNQPPTFHGGGYNRPIHEMTEMATFNMGQLALCNQPAFHFPYMYAAAGQPWKCEALTRKVCDEKINSGPRGFPGDEDNGSMGSWYILSTLGFYPLTPGHPSYVLTSPAFTKATLTLPDGKTFVISAPGNSPANVYVQKRLINGKEYTNTWISHQTLTSGGTMTLQLGDKPLERVVKDDELPYSASHP